MESRIEQAVRRHKQGYNCAQAVVCTYCDLFGVDEETAYRMSEGFGFGMGMQGVCGAMAGVFLLVGLQGSGGIAAPGKTKAKTYATNRALTAILQEQAGGLLCSDIKTPPVKRTCDGCVEDAARLVEEMLLQSQEI